VRLPADLKRARDGLVDQGAAPSRSQVIREALMLYAHVVAHTHEGWRVVALTPRGDLLAVEIPCMGQNPNPTPQRLLPTQARGCPGARQHALHLAMPHCLCHSARTVGGPRAADLPA